MGGVAHFPFIKEVTTVVHFPFIKEITTVVHFPFIKEITTVVHFKFIKEITTVVHFPRRGNGGNSDRGKSDEGKRVKFITWKERGRGIGRFLT